MVDELEELLKQSLVRHEAMNDSQKLRMWYEQRRSFVKGMCSDTTDYDRHCSIINKSMPHESELTDAQIGLVLVGQYHGK